GDSRNSAFRILASERPPLVSTSKISVIDRDMSRRIARQGVPSNGSEPTAEGGTELRGWQNDPSTSTLNRGTPHHCHSQRHPRLTGPSPKPGGRQKSPDVT